MLGRLAFFTGGDFDARAMRVLATEHEGFSWHFDPDKQLAYDRWRLLYLSRHGRIGPEFFEEKPAREIERWVEELSEMLKAEYAGAKKAASAR